MRPLQKLFQDMKVPIEILNLHLYKSIDNEYHIVRFLACLMNIIASLEDLFVHEELNLMKELFIIDIQALLEIVNLFKQLDFELDPLVVVV